MLVKPVDVLRNQGHVLPGMHEAGDPSVTLVRNACRNDAPATFVPLPDGGGIALECLWGSELFRTVAAPQAAWGAEGRDPPGSALAPAPVRVTTPRARRIASRAPIAAAPHRDNRSPCY